MNIKENVQERDKVVIGIIKNYNKISPYNKGRLAMMIEMLDEQEESNNSSTAVSSGE